MAGFIDFLKSVAGICATQPLDQEHWEVSGNRVTVDLSKATPLREDAGAVYLKGGGLKRPVLIVRTEDGEYRSFANRCTHAGRKLDPAPGSRTLRCCSVSHSTFDYEGNKIAGPARGPLETYATEVVDDKLIVTV